MTMFRYGADGANLTLCGLPIDDFGDTDPAITIEDIEQRSTLKRGIGRSSVRLDNQTRPKRLTVNLMPGSEQVRQLLAIEKTGADASFSFRQSGTLETIIGFDGVLTNVGTVGRAGKSSVTDHFFTYEFSDSDEV